MPGSWEGQKEQEMGEEVAHCREEANEQNASAGDWDSVVIARRLKMPWRESVFARQHRVLSPRAEDTLCASKPAQRASYGSLSTLHA